MELGCISTNIIEEMGSDRMTREQAVEAMKVIAKEAGIEFTVEEKHSDYNFKQGDEYYYIDSMGLILQGRWKDTNGDRLGFSFGNVYRTREEAEKACLSIKIHNRLRMFAEEVNEGWKPDWTSHDELKWHCAYDEFSAYWITVGDCYTYRLNQVYFRTEELAQRAIDEVIIPYFKKTDK